jgi:hypothetical protein
VIVYPIIPVLLTGLRKSKIDTTTATAPFAFPNTCKVRGLVHFVTMKLLRFTKKAILQFTTSTNPKIRLDLQLDIIVSNANGSIILLDMLSIAVKKT